MGEVNGISGARLTPRQIKLRLPALEPAGGRRSPVNLPDNFYSKAYPQIQADDFPASVVKFVPQPLLDLVPKQMPVMNPFPADDQRKAHTGTPELNARFEIILDPVVATF